MSGGRGWELLGRVLAAGALFDFTFGVGILLFTKRLAAILGLDVPADPVYLGLDGVLLMILAGIYAVAARQPERYALVAPISGVGRVLGFLFFTLAWAGGRGGAFLALGLADLVLGATTLLAWRRTVGLSD